MKKICRHAHHAVSLAAALLVCGTALAAQPSADGPLAWPKQCAGVPAAPADAAADRMPALPAAHLSTAQQQAVAAISAGPRGCIFGPFQVLLRSPELLTRTQMLGAYLRFHADLPPTVREFAILVTGRATQSPYVWYIHEPIALRAGVTPETVQALAQQHRPPHMTAGEAVAYDFLDQLHRRHDVDDDVYTHAVAQFGEQGVVDLMGLDGYFSLLATQLNVARTPMPGNVKVPFAAPWQR